MTKKKKTKNKSELYEEFLFCLCKDDIFHSKIFSRNSSQTMNFGHYTPFPPNDMN